jgi:alpha-glucosidase
MPWSAEAPQLGFTRGQPWLPIGPDHAALAVDRQEADPGSLLNVTRRLIALRHSSTALMTGSIAIREAGEALLVFERQVPGQTLLCAFNLGERPVSLPEDLRGRRILQAVNGATLAELPPFAGLIAE